jgi:hypothetical protein
MATSGTISTTAFDTNEVIDEAFGLCGLAAQQITPEMQIIAQRQLYLSLSSMGNKGIPLWAIDKQILPLRQGQMTVPTPLGTIDILNCQYRTLTQFTGTETTRLGGLQTEFTTPTKITSVGVQTTADVTYSLVLETSADGVTWTTVGTTGSTAFTGGEWAWFDIDGPVAAAYFCIRDIAGTTLVLTSSYLGGNPYEVPMSRLNKDDYQSMPNKTFEGRPLQFWLDRQVDGPIMRLWPAADGTIAQIIILRHRHIMDVGTLQQMVEVPQRWYDAICLRLAYRMSMRIPQIDPGRGAVIAPLLQVAETEAWQEERDRSPFRLTFDNSAYTA